MGGINSHVFNSFMPATRLGRLAVVVLGLGLPAWFVFSYNHKLPALDDVIYGQAAFEYARTGIVQIPDAAAPTSVFESVWGGWFVRLLGPTFGSLRVATLVLAAVSGFAMYWLLHQLHASKDLAALGALAYAFNPMFFALSNSFMTDGHAVALMVISSAFMVRALRSDRHTFLYTGLAGSVSAVAFLSRQQSLILPGVAVIALLFSGRQRRLREAIALLSPVAVAVASHTIWISSVGEPLIRPLTISDAMQRTLPEIATLAARSLTFGIQYIGLFMLPFAPMVIGVAWKTRSKLVRPLPLALGVGMVVLGLGAVLGEDLALTHGTWWSATGLGAVDPSFLGARAQLVPTFVLIGVTVVSYLLAWLSLAGLEPQPRTKPVNTRVLLLLGSGFAGAAFLGSLAFHAFPLDRYWLPLLPLIMVALATRLPASGRATTATSLLVVLMALVSIVGTRDAFSAAESSVALADDAIASGVSINELDGGAPWTALAFGVPPIDPETFPVAGPFWVTFFAPGLEPAYGIALEPLEGYQVIQSTEYSSWLHLNPTYTYLLGRDPSLGFYIRPEDF